MSRSEERKLRQELLADFKAQAAAHRKETEAGIRNALEGPRPDRDFASNWGAQQAAIQEGLDATVRSLEPTKRWWRP